MKAYISGALSGVDDLEARKRLYERMAKICGQVGIDAYVPHLGGTDPATNPEVAPREVYERDMRHVDAADVVVAYVGERSLGVGAEIERAAANGADVVLLYEADRTVSRLIRGCPAVRAAIAFRGEDDALARLETELRCWIASSPGAAASSA